MYIPSTLAARKDFPYLEHTVAARDWGMCRRNAFTIAGNPCDIDATRETALRGKANATPKIFFKHTRFPLLRGILFPNQTC
jgi:hypothetical protein